MDKNIRAAGRQSSDYATNHNSGSQRRSDSGPVMIIAMSPDGAPGRAPTRAPTHSGDASRR